MSHRLLRCRSVTTAAALVPLWIAQAPGQSGPLKTTRVADGVYTIIRQLGPTDPSDANVTVIVNERDVVVVDANITPGSSQTVIAEIRRLTTKPVRYVINTHLHSDHMYGNMVYADAFPGVEFISHKMTRDDYIRVDIPALDKNLTTDYPATIERYRQALARGTTREGRAYTALEINNYKGAMQSLQWFMDEMKGFRHVPPTMTVTDSLVLHRGERRIVIKHLGQGNTRGDLIVYLPNERVVATGDLVVWPVPFAWESYPREWLGVLEQLRTHAVDVLVPGHGELQRDWKYVDQMIAAFRAALDETRAAVARDTSLTSVKKAVTLASFRGVFVGLDSTRAAGFDQFVDALVERSYMELRGRIPK